MEKSNYLSVKDAVSKLWTEVLKQEEINTSDSFLDIGGNSVTVFVLIEKVEQLFNYSLEPELFFDDDTSSVDNIAQVIFNAQQERTEEEPTDDYAVFERDGCLGPFKLCEPEEMNKIWSKVRLQLLRRDKAVFKDSKLNYDRHFDIEELKDVVQSDEIVSRLKNVMAEKLKCWRTEWFPKYPGDEGTEWHQAKNFFEFEGEPKVVPTEKSPKFWGCTVWVAFTDSTKENGCLKVVPGSHKESFFDEARMVSHNTDIINNKIKENEKQGFFGYNWDDLKKDADWKPNEEEAKYVEMKAGEFFIFTSQVLHGSLPNNSKDQSRFGMSIRYVTDDVQVYPDLKEFKALGETLVLEDWDTLTV